MNARTEPRTVSSYCPNCGRNTEQTRTEQSRTVVFRCRGCQRTVTFTESIEPGEVA